LSFVRQSGLGPSGNRIRGLGRRDIVYLLSDVYDTDPAPKTFAAIQTIRNKGAELFWLRPTVTIPQSEAIQLIKKFYFWIYGGESLG